MKGNVSLGLVSTTTAAIRSSFHTYHQVQLGICIRPQDYVLGEIRAAAAAHSGGTLAALVGIGTQISALLHMLRRFAHRPGGVCMICNGI